MNPTRLLPAALCLAACGDAQELPSDSGPPPLVVADSAFDASAWMEGAAVVWDSTTWSASYDSALVESRRYADELNASLPWRETCDLPAEEQADTTASWGIMNRYSLGQTEHLVSISCEVFASQGTFVIVYTNGPRARLVVAEQFDDTGAPADSSALFIGLERVDAPQRTFSIFTRARGVGDCGTLANYRVQPGGVVETLSVRARECIDVRQGEEEVPEEWPVVYPAQ
jgi:hypothetical protein